MPALPSDFIRYRNSVRQINRAAREDPASFAASCERDYGFNIRRIAERLLSGEPACRLVMLAGPSASGKTTSAHLLADALRELGNGAEIISLDDFYRGEHQAPLLPDGRHDYEHVEALDVGEVRACLSELLARGRCDMPVFDFSIHLPYPHRRHVVLGEGEVAVVEGIHALNPVLIGTLPQERIRRVYISVKQGIRDEAGELFGPDDVRLVRRIVRDRNFRSAPPATTLSMWRNVMAGEQNYIRPFQKDADFTVNSFHAYEPCVLKDQAAALLRAVPERHPERETALRLLGVLERFESMDTGFVPKNSILREFIGGGIY